MMGAPEIDLRPCLLGKRRDPEVMTRGGSCLTP